MIFYEQSLFYIFNLLRSKLGVVSVNDTIEFEVIDPDISNEFSGTEIRVSGHKYIYRPFKVWVDLAEALRCKVLTPRLTNNNHVLIRYKPLNISKSWHNHSGVHITEKYGVNSDFFKIFKFEEPHFLNDYLRSINEIPVKKGMRVINLGINRGDEFKIFAEVYKDRADSMQFTGIDHCSSAIKKAENSFSPENFKFINEDISNIESWDLPKQDIIISIGTLQSPDFNGKEIIRYIIQNMITKEGSIILGIPNSRYMDCEVVYGAKTKNYRESNLNLIIKDIYFYKRYLQQHGFKVQIFGKYYIFIVGTKLS